MKRLQAFIAAVLMTALLVGGMLAIGIDAARHGSPARSSGATGLMITIGEI